MYRNFNYGKVETSEFRPKPISLPKPSTKIPNPTIPKQCITKTKSHEFLFQRLGIHPKLAHAKAATSVLTNPLEQDEFFKVKQGFLSVQCPVDIQSSISSLASNPRNSNVKWLKSLVQQNPDGSEQLLSGLTILLEREEYANVFWTILDFYDIFVIVRNLNTSFANTRLLIIDAHYSTRLDELWAATFKEFVRLSEISNPVILEKAALRQFRESSLLLKRYSEVPLVEELAKEIWKSFDLRPRIRNCAKPTLLIVWRRDYKSHPRNPQGKINRKVKNEREVVDEIQSAYPSFVINEAQLDSITIEEQIKLIHGADIFFAMHGAAHALTLFMKPKSAVIEIFPDSTNAQNWHMEKVALSAKHKHIKYVAPRENTYNRFTTIPQGISKELIGKALDFICPS